MNIDAERLSKNVSQMQRYCFFYDLTFIVLLQHFQHFYIFSIYKFFSEIYMDLV